MNKISTLHKIQKIQTDKSSIDSSLLMPPPKALTKTTNKTNKYFLGHKRETSTLASNTTKKNFYTNSISSSFFYVPEAHSFEIENKNLYDQLKKKNRNFSSKKFMKLSAPKNDNEIKCFIKNILDYLEYLSNNLNLAQNNKNLFHLRTRIEVRYQDYIQQGLSFEYFVLCLMRMQNELISIICLYDRALLENDDFE